MATPYTHTFLVTATPTSLSDSAGQTDIIALDFPGRGKLERITAVTLAGTFSAKLYSRAQVSDAVTIKLVTNNGAGNCALELYAPLPLRVGDVVTVQGTGVYDQNHRITRRVDDKHYETDVAFATELFGAGSVFLNIPDAEYEAYALTDFLVDGVTDVDNSYMNQDPMGNLNTGVTRKLYLRPFNTFTVKLTLQASIGVALGD